MKRDGMRDDNDYGGNCDVYWDVILFEPCIFWCGMAL